MDLFGDSLLLFDLSILQVDLFLSIGLGFLELSLQALSLKLVLLSALDSVRPLVRVLSQVLDKQSIHLNRDGNQGYRSIQDIVNLRITHQRIYSRLASARQDLSSQRQHPPPA